jgi:hypothetical protein
MSERIARTKIQGRVPDSFIPELARIAEENGWNASDAIAFVVAAGLSELTGQEFDAELDEKPSNDDVAPFREWLINVANMKPRQASLTASWVRRAYRSGDPKAFNEDPALEAKVRGTRVSAWRYWVEYCISNGINFNRVHVSGM